MRHLLPLKIHGKYNHPLHSNNGTFISLHSIKVVCIWFCLYRCSLCLGDYQEKQVLRIMPKCGHNFHLSCIDLWLRKQSTCPVCRFPLQDIGETKQMRAATFRTMITLQSPQCSSSSTNSEMNT